VREASRLACWKIMPTLSRRTSSVTTTPSTRASPVVGEMSPAATESRDDFPDPDSPTTAVIRPAVAVMVTWSRAVTRLSPSG